MGIHQQAIDNAQVTQLASSRLDFVVGPFKKLSQLLKPGTSITITNDCITGNIGREKFMFATQPHELEADLEAFYRISQRRISG